jgi:NADH:ubiquinone oxidoreductase subunit K
MKSTMNLHSAAEDAVGLTLLIAISRHCKTTNLDPVDAMRE